MGRDGAKRNMKRFEIITEADARVLEIGETVSLVRGGHVTPLAADTLKARRVTVLSDETLARAEDNLAPPADIRRVAIGSDHGGLALKAALTTALRGRGLAVDDLGTATVDPVDYPDTASRVAKAVARGEADAGIVIDGAGVGSAMTANKVPGVRAAACYSVEVARNSREHNDANVLTLGSKTISADQMREIVRAWLGTELTEDRHRKRVNKIEAVERQYQR